MTLMDCPHGSDTRDCPACETERRTREPPAPHYCGRCDNLGLDRQGKYCQRCPAGPARRERDTAARTTTGA